MRQMESRRSAWCITSLILALSGCTDRGQEAPALAPTPAPALASHFDPATACTLRGQVTWDGEILVVPPFEVWSIPLAEDGSREKHTAPNPNAPAVDPHTRGVANAVVFLRGVDSGHARPWDHPPVRVEMRDRQFHVLQGDRDTRVGFVRRGDRVEMVSRDPVFHAVHADGAAYFTLAFPDPDSPCGRQLNERDVVELSSAAGRYAMRAYLFVDDQPYYTRTDAAGRFVLENVPPGRYEVVCWLPNWVMERYEHDPETAVISRLYFRPPIVLTQPVAVTGRPADSPPALHFTVSSGASNPPKSVVRLSP